MDVTDYKFGPCERPGCKAPAIFRVKTEKVCKDHKGADVVFAPFLGQQEKFFQRRERVVFFGGAAGGAKSRSLWVKFGQQLAVEYARAQEARKRGIKFKSRAWGIYFRRTTPNFRQAFERCEEDFRALDPAAVPDRNTHTWTFPSCGNAVFQFAHMEHVSDRFKYKSVEATYIAFDELTEFDEVQYDYMDTRLRTTDPHLEPYLQTCSASNPDGQGLIWVRERFIEPVPPETVMRIETVLGDGRVVEYDQVFIPSKLTDNPILMESGTYEASLMNKRPEVREALLNGNWYISPGAFFGRIWDTSLHVVEDHDIPENAKIFRAADWGIMSPSSIGWFYEDADGGLTMFAHLRTVGLTVDRVADKMIAIESRYGLWDEEAQQSRLNMARNPLDAACFGGGQGLIGGRTIAKDFRDLGFRWKPSKKGPGSRVLNLAQMVKRMTTLIPEAFKGATEPTERMRPMLRFMKSCVSPIRTIPVIATADNNVDDVDTDGDDHDVDCCMYACAERTLDVGLRKREDDDDDDEIPSRSRTIDRMTLGTPVR